LQRKSHATDKIILRYDIFSPKQEVFWCYFSKVIFRLWGLWSMASCGVYGVWQLFLHKGNLLRFRDRFITPRRWFGEQIYG